jgi:hypothetical protein
MSLLMATVTHKQPTMSGTFTFDGKVFEAFGFNELHSVRIPIELIESVELSLEKGMVKQPHLEIAARGGCLGLTQGFEADDTEVSQLQDLVEAVRRAIG